MDYVLELVRFAAVNGPREQPNDSDWHNVETQIGYEFPPDLKMLVSKLGSGYFGCGLILHNPRTSIEHACLSRASLIDHRRMMFNLERRLNLRFFPDPGGMVLIGRIDQQYFYLSPENALSKALTILVWLDSDMDTVTPLNLTLSQFIHDLYMGLVTEPWGDEMRRHIWRQGKIPFFSSFPAPND